MSASDVAILGLSIAAASASFVIALAVAVDRLTERVAELERRARGEL